MLTRDVDCRSDLVHAAERLVAHAGSGGRHPGTESQRAPSSFPLEAPREAPPERRVDPCGNFGEVTEPEYHLSLVLDQPRARPTTRVGHQVQSASGAMPRVNHRAQSASGAMPRVNHRARCGVLHGVGSRCTIRPAPAGLRALASTTVADALGLTAPASSGSAPPSIARKARPFLLPGPQRGNGRAGFPQARPAEPAWRGSQAVTERATKAPFGAGLPRLAMGSGSLDRGSSFRRGLLAPEGRRQPAEPTVSTHTKCRRGRKRPSAAESEEPARPLDRRSQREEPHEVARRLAEQFDLNAGARRNSSFRAVPRVQRS